MRRLVRADVNPALNTLTDVLTCPAGSKLEVIDYSAYGDAAVTFQYLWLIHSGASYLFVDDHTVQVGDHCDDVQVGPWILNAGESLAVEIITTSAVRIPFPITYVEVSPVL